MARRMLIDATHPEETRVVAVSGNRLEEFDYETATKLQLKGNIYLAKVTRVEPSLQAAFVDYGGNRHGFLAFSEIHPDYYRIPVADREDLVEEDSGDDDENGDAETPVEELGGDEGAEEAVEEAQKRRPRLRRHYKIQEVIKRRQVLLVQVIKEERGSKGAALTTYLSLAGRYCVLMPNTSRGGGVSRKIANPQDRKRLKAVMSDLGVPDGMAVILRTAGQERSKAEIKRDYEYIMRMWDGIRSKTLESMAPALIHEEANLIRRSIRDLYSKDIDEIFVAGDEAYRIAKDFMKAMIPSHAKKVQRYKDEGGVPLFQRYQVEAQLTQIYDPVVQLRSGGSIVMHQTEALVAIDVNSGRATRERHIEETALKTNLEAAEEIARQLRLRDMAGLVVIDFIDMEENRNDQAVERRLKEALRRDRARIQVGRISPFGLMEMSRQRLRPSLLEAMTQPCHTCGGIGYIPSTESAALQVLRAVEEEGLRKRSKQINVKAPPSVALYLFNHKRATLAEMEQNSGFRVMLETDEALIPPNYVMTRIAHDADDENPVESTVTSSADQSEGGGRRQESRTDGRADGEGRGRKRGRRRRRRYDEEGETEAQEIEAGVAEGSSDAGDAAIPDAEAASEEDDKPRRRRKRGRRGGRKRREDADAMDAAEATEADDAQAEPQSGLAAEDTPQEPAEGAAEAAPGAVEPADAEKPKRTRRGRRGGRRSAAPVEDEADSADQNDAAGDPIEASPTEPQVDPASDSGDDLKPAKKPRRARKASAKKAAAKSAAEKAPATSEAAEPEKADPEKTDPEKTDPGLAATVAPSSEIFVPDETESSDAPMAESAPETPAEPIETPSAPSEAAPEAETPSDQPKRKGWWNRITGS
ncbi:MAG: Rne/Rng family ribonuclease [Alphaproteobacteria bacterium]|nr:Rne/Rng family ribonuclease [Alphaproteobacteria bacterium]